MIYQNIYNLSYGELIYTCKGAFTNYIDKILAFFDHLPPCVDIFYGMNIDKKWTFWTTYVPRLVNVICEQPLNVKNKFTLAIGYLYQINENSHCLRKIY